jgi:hypothetical protein
VKWIAGMLNLIRQEHAQHQTHMASGSSAASPGCSHTVAAVLMLQLIMMGTLFDPISVMSCTARLVCWVHIFFCAASCTVASWASTQCFAAGTDAAIPAATAAGMRLSIQAWQDVLQVAHLQDNREGQQNAQ